MNTNVSYTFVAEIMCKKRENINFFRIFLPVLFVSYLAGITLFTHSHVVNGVTIVHSHPFNKEIEHGHTTTEFQLIYQLSHVITSGEIFFPFSLISFSVFFMCFAVKTNRSKVHNSLSGSRLFTRTSCLLLNT